MPMTWLRLPDWPAFWTDTAYDRWSRVVEQRGVDGRYRRRVFDDMLRPIGWEAGPCPIAQKLRDDGLDRNYSKDSIDDRNETSRT